MRTMLFVILFGCSCCAFAQQKPVKKKLYTFSGTITHTSEYCGGPAPTDEMVKDLSTPKPYAGKVLFLKRGKSNSAKTKKIGIIHADSNGFFSIRLPAGSYCIVQESQLKPVDLKTYKRKKWLKISSAECMKQWWHRCFYQVNILSSDVSGFRINFHHRCFIDENNPCLQYDGPMPP